MDDLKKLADDPEQLEDAVAVVGMAGRFPGAANVEALWELLRAGRSAITTASGAELEKAGVPRALRDDPRYVGAAGRLDGYALHDAALFGDSPREAELLDPQHRLFLEQSWAALEDAAVDPRRGGGRVGVYAGCGMPLYLVHHVAARFDRFDPAGSYPAALANDKDFLATRVAYRLGLEGPALTVQTACSTSLVAVAMACQALVGGECDTALAGGVSLRLPMEAGYLYQPEGILSPDGTCRAFDRDAAGTVPASGVGVVVLRRLEDALADGDPVRAVLRGWALNNDGAAKAGYTAPRLEGQREVIAEALALAGVGSETVGYVEAHGTGTRLGDPIEIAALGAAFTARRERPPEAPCVLGSLKSNLGHLDQAAGVAALIKTVLALEHGEIPPSLGYEAPNPEIDFAKGPFRVARELEPWPRRGAPRRGGVSSFGIGGTNVHVVVEEAPARPDERGGEMSSKESGGWRLLTLSAKTPSALEAVGSRLAEALKQGPKPVGGTGSGAGRLDAVAATLQLGRRQLEERRVVLCRDVEGAITALESTDPRRTRSARVDPGHRSTCFLFPGQGAQYPGMARGLYEALPVLRRELDRCAVLLRSELGFDLREAIFPAAQDAAAAARLRATELAQPALFAVSWAMARQWMAWGVEPEAVVGHSIGQYVAAALAEVFSLEDALHVVAERGRLLAFLEGGAMAAVALGEDALAAHLDACRADGFEVSLAAVNGPAACSVSGRPADVDALLARLDGAGVVHRRLHTSHAFHSAVVEPILEPFREVLGRIALRPPRIPLLCDRTGTWMDDQAATDPESWVRQLREPVRFAGAVESLLEEPSRVLLEVGPGENLTTLVRGNPAARGRAVTASGRHPQDSSDDLEALLRAVGDLWLAGVEIDFAALQGSLHGAPPRRVALPTYPFEGRRAWLEATTAEAGKTLDPAARTEASGWLYAPVWNRLLPDASTLPRADDREAAWLVLVDRRGFAEPWLATLREAGERVVVVRSGADGAAEDHRLEGSSRASHDELAKALELGSATWRGVVDLRGLRPPTPLADGDVDADQLAAAFLGLAGMLARHVHRQVLPVITAVNGLWDVVGGDAFGAERAVLAGLARVTAQEHPNLRCRVVDLDWRDPSLHPSLDRELDRELAASLAELVEPDDGPLPEPAPTRVAWRGGHRWVQSFERLDAPLPAEDAPSPWPEGCHVLITGGLGRFGRWLASHLAKVASARLSLIDIRPATPDDEALGGDFEALGDRLLTLEADVADGKALGRAVGRAIDRFGPPEVVFHAAGAEVGGYQTVAETTLDACRAHFAPKGRGLAHLARALEVRQIRPRLCLATSSLSATLGGVGLASFAAADAWLEALCAELRASTEQPWTAVAWEAWQAAWEEGDEAILGAAQNALMLTPEEVAATCDRLAASGVPGLAHVLVSTGDLGARLDTWTRLSRRAVSPATSRDTGVPHRPPSSPLEAKVAEIWGRALGVENLGVDDDFFLLGGSSLVGLQILSEMRGELDVELPLRSFFEARTVAGVVEVVGAERAKAAAEAEHMADLLAEIENLSDEEVAALLEAEAAQGEQGDG